MPQQYLPITGKKLDLKGWDKIQEKRAVMISELPIKDLYKERYTRVINGITYSMGVYYYREIIDVIAFGPIGTCIGHARVASDGNFYDYKDGCIDFSRFV